MELKISRIFHAGYIFEYQGKKIAFDPLFENPFSFNCYAFPDLEINFSKLKELELHAIFISHYHDDHFSLESLNLLNKNTPIYYYCTHEGMGELLNTLDFKNCHSIEINEKVKIGEFNLHLHPALNADVDSIFQLQVGGYNILNVVDSWIDDYTFNKLASLGPWDVILWPFQKMQEYEVLAPDIIERADCTIPIENKLQLKNLNPQFIVPSSCQFLFEDWSWYNQMFFPISYQGFKKQVLEIIPKTKVVIMNPGSTFLLNKDSFKHVGKLDWITVKDIKIKDYIYEKNMIVPNTSEISKKFPKLNSEATKIVIDYCEQGLIDRYSSFNCTPENYFFLEKVWELKIYNQDGESISYFYLVANGCLKRSTLAFNADQIGWRTEISIYKLYSAITKAESLISLYLRINSGYFSEIIRDRLLEAEIMEDPLICTLYGADVFSYQKGQLKRIKAFQKETSKT